jgi:hypothetical protein
VSYQFYLVLHFTGVFLILFSLGGVALHVINGGTREYPARKWAAMGHGIGLLIALVGGFGLLARLGIMHGGQGLPLWIWVKLCVWLALGAAPVLLYRQRQLSKVWWFLILVLGMLAATMAIYKPTMQGSGSETQISPAGDPALAPPTSPGAALEAAPPPATTPNP